MLWKPIWKIYNKEEALAKVTDTKQLKKTAATAGDDMIRHLACERCGNHTLDGCKCLCGLREEHEFVTRGIPGCTMLDSRGSGQHLDPGYGHCPCYLAENRTETYCSRCKKSLN